MTQIKNIIFDLGGVLLNIDTKITINEFRKMGLLHVEELFRVGFAASFFKDYEAGMITDQEFIGKIRAHTVNNADDHTIITAWNALLLDFPEERVLWLMDLKKKYRLFLFSNTNAIHLEHFQAAFLERYQFHMDDLFERAYYSHVAKIRKPDVAAYELVLRENELIPSETIFVDDALVNVEAANTTGIRGIHLLPGKTVVELEF